MTCFKTSGSQSKKLEKYLLECLVSVGVGAGGWGWGEDWKTSLSYFESFLKKSIKEIV